MHISHKLLALGLGGVIATAAVLVVAGAWESSNFADNTEREVVAQNDKSLNRLTTNVTTLVQSVGNVVQDGVDVSLNAATGLLAQRGGARLSDRTATWTAINQVWRRSSPGGSRAASAC